MYTMSRATNVYRSNFKLDIEPKPKLYARWDYDLMRQLAFLEGRLPNEPHVSESRSDGGRRKVLAAVTAAARAGDVRGLLEIRVPQTSSTTRNISLYRDLCVIAVQAKMRLGELYGE
jgi:hypothetical protein